MMLMLLLAVVLELVVEVVMLVVVVHPVVVLYLCPSPSKRNPQVDRTRAEAHHVPVVAASVVPFAGSSVPGTGYSPIDVGSVATPQPQLAIDLAQ